jgi:hypothetical protein
MNPTKPNVKVLNSRMARPEQKKLALRNRTLNGLEMLSEIDAAHETAVGWPRLTLHH